MALLSKKIEEVRARHMDEAGRELAQVIELGARLQEANGRINEALDDVLVECASQRALIHHKLVTIAQCAGLVPPPAEPAEPQALDAAAEDSTRAVATRFAPPRQGGAPLAPANGGHYEEAFEPAPPAAYQPRPAAH